MQPWRTPPELLPLQAPPLLARNCPTETPSRWNCPALEHLDGPGRSHLPEAHNSSTESAQQAETNHTTTGGRTTDPHSNLLSTSSSEHHRFGSKLSIFLLAKSALLFLPPSIIGSGGKNFAGSDSLPHSHIIRQHVHMIIKWKMARP